jgi:hypothetical protein
MLALAATRGCKHYAPSSKSYPISISRAEISDTELTTLLLLGENEYSPMAIRCAAQLARSPHVKASRLAQLAIMGKCERVIAHIARAGIEHDPDGIDFWQELLNHLSAPPPQPEPDLPHWSRFVSMPGIQRSGTAPTRWLIPQL